MLKKAAWGMLLGMLLAVQPLWAEEAEKPPPPPKIKDVKVWYYPPGGARPVALIWWEPEKLHIGRRMQFSRQGKFRIRVELEGGFMKDGQLINYVSLAFRDQNSVLWSLPSAQSLTRNKIKDVYWRIPTRFASGNIDFQVAVWNDVLPVTSLMFEQTDRTDFFILGVIEFPR